VVFPNYSLSPEAKYPTAIEESYAVAAWVAQHGAEQDLDLVGDKWVVSAESADPLQEARGRIGGEIK
jgi:hypothetical protein